jgi:stage II sporulation protein Q
MIQNMVPSEPYVTNEVMDNITPTIATKEAIIRPYNDSSVEATIPFYNQNGTDSEQQAALIYYENIYMENTGVMYTSPNSFNALSVLDGTVKDIKEDNVMGKIVEVENNKNITTIYQSLETVNVKIGDNLKQGDVIGVAGKNTIVGSDRYSLHFEVFKKGEIIDPEQFYLLSLDDIND